MYDVKNELYEKQIVQLKDKIKADGHLVGAVVGSGIAGKYAIKGGSDLLFAMSSGKFRSMGFGSLAGYLSYANSNDLVMEYAGRELLRYNSQVPVIFGFHATDPTRNMYEYIQKIKQTGFAGLINYPTIGMIDGKFREALEEEDIDYSKEIEAIHFAHYCGLLTAAYVFHVDEAAEMAKAGADIICVHFGLTSGGYLGASKTLTLEKARRTAAEIFTAVDAVNPDIIKMIYGGPVKTPVDAQYMYQGSRCQGYIGGSVFDRTPIEEAVLQATRSFKDKVQMVPRTNLERILFANPEHYDYVEFIKEYIEENYMNEIYLSELAQSLHLSMSYLSTLFKNTVGTNFQSYLVETRMKKARAFIKDGRYSLVQVAQMTGYQDYAQFSKMYKKVCGNTPKADFNNRK